MLMLRLNRGLAFSTFPGSYEEKRCDKIMGEEWPFLWLAFSKLMQSTWGIHHQIHKNRNAHISYVGFIEGIRNGSALGCGMSKRISTASRLAAVRSTIFIYNG